jgi:hypothetical protein
MSVFIEERGVFRGEVFLEERGERNVLGASLFNCSVGGDVSHVTPPANYCKCPTSHKLKKYGVRISMTEDYKPTDNAIAERVNGILKTEVIYRERRFKTYGDALERISGFILFYNDTRPHYSIGMKTPSEVHTQTGPQKVMWKSAGRLSGAVCPLPQGTP